MTGALNYDRTIDLDLICRYDAGLASTIAEAGLVPSDKWHGPGVEVAEIGPNQVEFRIPMLIGSGTVGQFLVLWQRTGDTAHIRSVLGTSLTKQSKVLSIIPIGPRKVLALRRYSQSVGQIQATLFD